MSVLLRRSHPSLTGRPCAYPFQYIITALCSVQTRGYASRQLSKRVSRSGKGKTLFAKAKPKPKRAEPSAHKRTQMSFRTRIPAAARPTTLDMGEFGRLHSVPIEEKRVHSKLLERITSFNELRIHPLVRQNIPRAVGVDREIKGPTPIQTVAIKALRTTRKNPSDFKSWLIAAETGSGKTLAYLAPIMSSVLETKEKERESVKEADETGQTDLETATGTERGSGPRVSAVVLLPTLELVSQVAKVVAGLAPPGTRYLAMDTQSRNSSLSKQVVRGVDVLIATPDKFLSFFDHYKSLQDRALAHCRWIAVDEADSLMNQSFLPSTTKVTELCPQLTDLVMCSATIPRFFDKALHEHYPETMRLVSPSLHRLPRHIEFRIIEVFRPPYRDNKDLALQQALYSIYNDGSESSLTKRVVVFVNKRGQVAPLVSLLTKNGYPAVGMDGKLSADDRKQLLEDFVVPAKPSTSQDDRMKVLVATDLVARGIDMQRIRNVILYDLPWSSADLLHRAGRTGRLNTNGRVILLVSRKENSGWVKGLATVVKNGMALA